MLLPEVVRGGCRAAETRGAHPSLSASRCQLQITPNSALPGQPETASGLPSDRETSGEAAVSR